MQYVFRQWRVLVIHFIFSGMAELREERNLSKALFVLHVVRLLKSIQQPDLEKHKRTNASGKLR